MARPIKQFEATNVKLTPSNAGYSAWEMAGRRIGPFYDAAARAVKEVADLEGQTIKEKGIETEAYARYLGLAEKSDQEAAKGGGVKYGGGLKDMFQLGAGGNEPNYAALNRLAELQDGSLALAHAARGIVNAQSPVTHNVTEATLISKIMNGEGLTDAEYQQLGTTPAAAAKLSDQQYKQQWPGASIDYGKTGVQPNPEPTDAQFDGQQLKQWYQDWGGIVQPGSGPNWYNGQPNVQPNSTVSNPSGFDASGNPINPVPPSQSSWPVPPPSNNGTASSPDVPPPTGSSDINGGAPATNTTPSIQNPIPADPVTGMYWGGLGDGMAAGNGS